MPSLACPACGQPATEFDPRCASCGSPLPGSSAGKAVETGEVAAGQVIAHFRILGPLGRGGMGVVYRALDLDLEREVALKFLAPRAVPSAREEARFRREALAAAALDHPNIGTLHGLGEHAGRRFLVMALYEGETLDRRLERPPPPLPIPEAAAVVGQLASALAAAHAAGVVHRDLKPSNVMLMRDGRVKLLDFGLARRSGEAPLTEVGIAVGTAAYMAPEQLRSEEADARADLWALGVVLYEMLAGRHPFGGTAQPGMVHAILHEPPPALHEVRGDVPPALENIVDRCLAKDPARRWQNAGEILTALETGGLWSFGPGTGATAALSLPPRRTHLLGWAAALVLLTVLAILFWRSRQPEPAVYVAVPRPQVTGEISADERARAALNLQVAALRALTALEGVAPIDPGLLGGVSGTPAQLARTVAAQEVVTAESACTADTCVVTLRRLAGEDGRVLWTEVLRLLPGRPFLAAEAVTSAVRRAYPDRETRLDSPELAVNEAEYRRFLDLRQALDDRSVPPEQILEQLADLRRRAPSFLEAYALESSIAASLYGTSGDRKYLDRGLEVAHRAREIAPEDPRPLTSLFDLTLAAGRLDEAAALLEDIEGMSSGRPSVLLLRQARLAEHRGDAEAAAGLLARAAENHPSWEVLQTLANLEYRLGRFDAARGRLEELLRRSPGNVRGLETLAQIELLDGDPARAVELYSDLARRTGSADHWSNLGTALLLLKRYEDAERVFRRALSAAPGNPLVELNLADSLWLLGRRDEAAAVYRRLVERIGGEATISNWQLHSAKAQALAHLGEEARAVESVQEVLRLTPDNPQAAFEASLVYTLVGDRSSALVYADKAVREGVGRRWFSFPWFDPLRQEPSFASVMAR